MNSIPDYTCSWSQRSKEIRCYGLMMGMLQGLRFYVDASLKDKINEILTEAEAAANPEPEPLAKATMPSYQQRVIDEKTSLDECRVRLAAFFCSDTYNKLDASEQGRLRYQLRIMELYSTVLGDRIAAFPKSSLSA